MEEYTLKSETSSPVLHVGDCRDVLNTYSDDSFTACVTDPPYGLGFMGKGWDHGVPGVDFWREVLRVLKPGAPLLAFGGTRTYHRLVCAIEDAGFEIRDGLMWLYGSGFPKSLDIGKALDKSAGAEREVMGIYIPPDGRRRPDSFRSTGNVFGEHGGPMETPITAPATDAARLWDGWGTALKPGWEPIVLAMKPLDGTFAHNALAHGVAGLNVEGCRLETTDALGGGAYGNGAHRRPEYSASDKDATASLSRLNRGIPGFTQPTGRWPPNVMLDEGAAAMLDEQTGERRGATSNSRHGVQGTCYGTRGSLPKTEGRGDIGGASRFFYCPKASPSDRSAGGKVDNRHPTVKPHNLMRWLCRLVKMPEGTVILDPFMGSGSTGCAALAEGIDFVGIDLDPEHVEVARQRIAALKGIDQQMRQGVLF